MFSILQDCIICLIVLKAWSQWMILNCIWTVSLENFKVVLIGTNLLLRDSGTSSNKNNCFFSQQLTKDECQYSRRLIGCFYCCLQPYRRLALFNGIQLIKRSLFEGFIFFSGVPHWAYTLLRTLGKRSRAYQWSYNWNPQGGNNTHWNKNEFYIRYFLSVTLELQIYLNA